MKRLFSALALLAGLCATPVFADEFPIWELPEGDNNPAWIASKVDAATVFQQFVVRNCDIPDPKYLTVGSHKVPCTLFGHHSGRHPFPEAFRAAISEKIAADLSDQQYVLVRMEAFRQYDYEAALRRYEVLFVVDIYSN